ncbi:MAG: Wzy polymerase domain-containing protein [Gallionella sp.]|nr:Wzy polymerase domain-containing protein [Gallionella sp.]
MLKNALRPTSLPHISLALAGLMWVFPFLQYLHQYPITTFYQEWWSALLGVLALILLVSPGYWQKPEVPRIAQLPAALIGVLLLQGSMGMVAYFDQALLFILYLLFAVLLMLLGAWLRECFGMEKLAQVLAIFLLIGAEISALIGVMQHYRWDTPLNGVIVSKISSGVYGNLAQPNHFANYISLGLISLGLLYQHRRLKTAYVALLAAPLLFVLTLSGSRSSWLYLLLMAGLAWWWARRDAGQRPLLRYSLLLIAGFGLMHLIVQLPFMAGADSSINTMQRLFGDGASGGIRLYLWRESWLMFTQSPWLGVGFGQFAWHHFQLLPVLQQGNVVGLYNNAHNLIFHLAAETGVAGLLVLLVSLGVWLHGLRRATLDPAHWWGYAALGVLAIHSLLEYPLWYAYFVAVAAILLGALEETRYSLELRKVGRMSMAAILMLGLVLLVQLFTGYREMEQVLAIRPVSGVDKDAVIRFRDGLVAVHNTVLLSPYTEVSMSSLIDVSDDHIAEKLALNTRVMRFVPIAPVVYRQAFLLAQAGRHEQAGIMLEQAIWSYPGDFVRAQQQLVRLAEKDPAHFSALLEFGIRKAQEYHHAVYKR